MIEEVIVFDGKFKFSLHEILKAITRFRFDNFEAILGDQFGVEDQGEKQIWYRKGKSEQAKWIFGYIVVQQEMLHDPIPVHVKIVSCDETLFYIWLELAQRLQSAFIPGGLGYGAPVSAQEQLAKSSKDGSNYTAKIDILQQGILAKPNRGDSLEKWMVYYHHCRNLKIDDPTRNRYSLKDLSSTQKHKWIISKDKGLTRELEGIKIF